RTAIDNQLRRVDGLRERTNRKTPIQEGIEVASRSRRSLFWSVGIENLGASAGLIRPLGLCDFYQLSPQSEQVHSVVREPWPHYRFRDAAHRQRVVVWRVGIRPVVPSPDQFYVSR